MSKWERVEAEPASPEGIAGPIDLYRISVPGGWIYRFVRSLINDSVVFVPYSSHPELPGPLLLTEPEAESEPLEVCSYCKHPKNIHRLRYGLLEQWKCERCDCPLSFPETEQKNA